jgi:hypothetical protein
LLTAEVFAWTIVITALSWLFARLVIWLLRGLAAAVQRGAKHG